MLPGCKVVAEARSDGTYFIFDLELDDSYYDLNNNVQNTGLYFSKRSTENPHGWVHEELKGRLKRGTVKLTVGISDAYQNINKAARYVEEHIGNSPDKVGVRDGFHLFYTSGKSKFGGLLHIKEALGAASHKSLNEPAFLLADAMKRASNTPVLWVTQRGGSAVLAQAMGILKAQGITLPKHNIFLSNPTSSQTDIYRLMRQLEIPMDDKFANNNFLSIDELAGGLSLGAGSFSLIHERQKAEREFGWRKAISNLVTANGNMKSAAKTAGSLTGLASIGGLFNAGFTVASVLAAASPSGALAGAMAGVAAIGAANLPGLKDYNSPGKLMLKKMGF